MVTMNRWVYAVLCIVVPVLLVIACIFIVEGFRRPPEEAKRDAPLPLGRTFPRLTSSAQLQLVSRLSTLSRNAR